MKKTRGRWMSQRRKTLDIIISFQVTAAEAGGETKRNEEEELSNVDVTSASCSIYRCQ